MQKAAFTRQQQPKQNNKNNNKRPVAYAFMYLNSPRTKKQYPKRLKLFFDSIAELQKIQDLEQQGQAFLKQARQDEAWASEQLMFYLDHHKRRVFDKEISAGTLHNFLKTIKAFIDAYRDVSATIDWRRIRKALPRPKLYANDRTITLDEIRKLVQFPDRRIRAIVYLMCSTGIRIAAWDWMRWKHITPIRDEKTGEIIAARLLVYPGEGEEYITFMTPEAYRAVKEWIDFRASYEEKITGGSWVMRTVWRTSDMKKKPGKLHLGNLSKINEPERLTSGGINRILIRALYEQGIRDELLADSRRHPFQGVHTYRKFFKTRAEQAMLRTNVEWIIGHKLGLAQSYYRPTEQELLTDYLKAVPYLSINDDNAIDIKNIREEQQALLKKAENKDKELEYLKREMRAYYENMMGTIGYLAELVVSKPLTEEQKAAARAKVEKMEEKVEKLKKENPELDKLQDKLIQKRQREWMEYEMRIKNMMGLG